MNFFELWTKMAEASDQYFNRYLNPNDIAKGNIARFVQKHKDHPLSSIEPEWINGHLQNILTSQEREDRADNSIVASQLNNDDIKGMIFAMIRGEKIGEKWIEIPIFLADDSRAADMLIGTLFKRYMRTDEFKKKAIYIRAHYDPLILDALSRHGFGVQTHGDQLLAVYPKSNLQHKNLFGRYDQHLNNNIHSTEIAPKEKSDGDDNYGLFKDLPWQDNH